MGGGQLMMLMDCLSQVRPCHLLELEYVRDITGMKRQPEDWTKILYLWTRTVAGGEGRQGPGIGWELGGGELSGKGGEEHL